MNLIKKKTHIQQLPEERQCLQKLEKYVQKLVQKAEGVTIEKLEKYIATKKVFINPIATKFSFLVKEYKKHKDLIQLLYLIDYLCKNTLEDIFKEAIKDYICKIFLRVFNNVKQQLLDVTPLKIIFKSWFNIFPLNILSDTSRITLKTQKYDLDNLNELQISDLKKYYDRRGIQGYQDFLTGRYRQQQTQHTQHHQTMHTPQEYETHTQQKHIKKVRLEEPPIQQQQPLYKHQQQPYKFQTNMNQQPLTYIPQPIISVHQTQMPQIIMPTHNLLNDLNPHFNINIAPPQQQSNDNNIINQKNLYATLFSYNQDTIFGALFMKFTEITNPKQDIADKNQSKEFLKKVMQSTDLLFSPNKYSTLMKCPTCLMRFRNQNTYIAHLTAHARRKLDNFKNGAIIDQNIGSTIDQWLQHSTPEQEEQNTQQITTKLELEYLKNDQCLVCMEKFLGLWDSTSCKWVYENVRTLKLVSNDLDEPQLISLHNKCCSLVANNEKS